MLGAISSSHGVMFFERQMGSIRAQEYIAWLERFLRHSRDQLEIPMENLVVVIDNAVSHSKADIVLENHS